MPRRPPLLRLAPVPEDEEDDEVFFEPADKNDDKQRFLPKQSRGSSRFVSEDVLNNSDDEEENKVIIEATYFLALSNKISPFLIKSL